MTRSQTRKALVESEPSDSMMTRPARIIKRRQTIALEKIDEAMDPNNRPILFKTIETKPFRPRRHSEKSSVSPFIPKLGGGEFYLKMNKFSIISS